MIDEQIKLDIMRALANYYTEVDKVDTEMTALRELIRSLRGEVEAMPCRCEDMAEGRVCNRCFYMGIIDKGLAKIAKEREG